MTISKLLFTILALGATTTGFAQKTDGKTKSLLKAEKELDKALSKLGGAEGMLQFLSNTAIIFQPNAEAAKTYLATHKETFMGLKRTVNYANISKSGDWGVTSGKYQTHDAENAVNGDFLTVWKVSGAEGNWQIEADIETEHQNTETKIVEKFIESTAKFGTKSTSLPNSSEVAKVVRGTERTFAVMLKTYGMAAFTEFAANDVRLLYPSNAPIIGKDKLIYFLGKMLKTVSLTPQKVDVSKSADMAFTYGTASFQYNIDLKESLNYVAIWELQEEHKWNITHLVFIPVVR